MKLHNSEVIYLQQQKFREISIKTTTSILDRVLVPRFNIFLKFPYSFLNNLLSKSSSPTPSQTSSSGNSIRLPSASNGPPGFSTAAQTSTSNKFNYTDFPLEEELLDDSGDDLDSETEILIWIKDFLHNELGKSGVNVPMLLMNNIRSLGSDELVLQVSITTYFLH